MTGIGAKALSVGACSSQSANGANGKPMKSSALRLAHRWRAIAFA
jgi:hypothetical protein